MNTVAAISSIPSTGPMASRCFERRILVKRAQGRAANS